jgi:outer membrane protein assembly factor BamE
MIYWFAVATSLLKRMKKILCLAVCVSVFLSACASRDQVSSWLSPYRVEIRQGNYVTEQMLLQLRPGMSREQVRFVLGTPLLVDVFHVDRWDYVYFFKSGNSSTVEKRQLKVFFKDDVLINIDGYDLKANLNESDTPANSKKLIEISAPDAKVSAP